MLYNISKFSEMTGLHQNTLRNWDALGKLKPIILPSGHRRYDDSHLNIIKNTNLPKKILKNVIYVRESTKLQSNSLENQLNKCKEFCIGKGITIDEVIQDIGSGLNFNRNGLNLLIKMIENDEVSKIIIFYKDRLVRFGFEILETICTFHNVEIIIIDKTDLEKSKQEEFVEDIISIIHHFSMKLYGSRNYKQKTKVIENELNSFKETEENVS